MATKQLTFDLYGRDKTASSAIKGVGDTGQKVVRNLARVGTAMALATAAAVAGILATSVKAAAEAQKVAAQTEAVIKSTGGAAERTTDQIAELADELARMSGIDDELIQSGANVLLTFTKIRGVNFDRATKAVLNMSIALKTDMQSAAIQVGKALNDPIKGVATLGRAGVQFSEDQKAMIRSLVETGDVAGAQAIILEELNTQFGESAEAFGSTYEGTLGRFEVAIGNLQEKIGEAFLPILSELVTFIGDTLLPIIESELVPIFEDFADWLAGDGKVAVKEFVTFLADNVHNFDDWATGIGILTGAMWGLNAAMTANPVGAFIAGLAAVAAAGFWIYNNFFSLAIGFQKVVGGLILGFAGFIEGILNMAIDAANGLRSIVGMGPLPKIDLTSRFQSFNNQIINAAARGVTGGWDAITNVPVAQQWNSGATPMAAGGIVAPTPGGIPAIIGEGRWPEAVVPLSPQNLAAMSGGGGVTVEIINNGGPGLMEFIDARIRYADGRSESILVGGKVPGK